MKIARTPKSFRTASRRIFAAAIFLLGIGFAIGCRGRMERADGMGFTTAEEKLPDEVREKIEAQKIRFFGSANHRRIPLLDPAVNWNDFENWPDEFKFQGYQFRANYAYLGSDYISGVTSRGELLPTHGYSAHYLIQTNGVSTHSFYSSWSRHGCVREKGIRWNREDVFTLQFYPDGSLYMFAWEELGGMHQNAYYDPSGQKVATREGSSKSSIWRWKGKEMTSTEVLEKVDQMRRGQFPPEA